MSTSLATRAMPDGFRMTLYSVKCTGACTRTPSRYRLMVASTTTMLAGHHFSLQYAHLSFPKFRYVRIWKSRLPGTCRHCAIFSKAWLGVSMDIHGKQLESNVCTYINIFLFLLMDLFINILKYSNISYVFTERYMYALTQTIWYWYLPPIFLKWIHKPYQRIYRDIHEIYLSVQVLQKLKS